MRGDEERMQRMALEIVYLPPESLKPYERNTRKHEPADIEQIKQSIKLDGFNDPIGIWGGENLIVEGHGRQIAALELGLETVPCIRLDHMTDEQRRDYAIRHNRTAELSSWDFRNLSQEIAELEISGIDFSGLDFNLDFEAAQQIDIGKNGTVEDNYKQPLSAKSKRGDVYQLGNHRLMCGDSLCVKDVSELMGAEKAVMVFTDPPYNVASDSKNFASDCSKAMNDLANSEWDKGFDIEKAVSILELFLAKDVSVYVCSSHFLAPKIWDWMKLWADHYSYCVWSKPNPMPSLSKRHWTWNTELVCYATRGKHTFNFPEEGHALSTWTINKRNGATGHPTEKPVEVSAMAISHSSNTGDVVLDLYGGSGSTLIACEQLGRACRMMELDPRYVDVIVSRWEQFTGKKAVLLKGGE